MLPWREPNGPGGILAEFQEATDQVAELGQRLIIGLCWTSFLVLIRRFFGIFHC
jgi:hypothetical protein